MSWYGRISNAILSYVEYLGQTFWPANLAAFYPHPANRLSAGKSPGRPVAGGDFRGRIPRGRKHRYLLVGWLWYLGMLVPVIGLVQVGPQAPADRYMYLPQIGLAIAVAWGAAELTKNWRLLPLLCGGVSAAMLVALAWCSWLQTRYWHDSLTLWTHALELDFDGNNDIARS